MVKSWIGKTGYRLIRLSKCGEVKHHSIHRLVATTFIPNPNKLPQVNHKDGNKLNNSVDNLEWCTQSENMQHAYETGLEVHPKGEETWMAKLTKEAVKWIRESYIPYDPDFGQCAMARMFGVSRSTIQDIVENRTWRGV